MDSPEKRKPWYRELWPWLLMAGPFLALLGCLVTIYLAFTHFSHQAIQQGVNQRGLLIERSAEPVMLKTEP